MSANMIKQEQIVFENANWLADFFEIGVKKAARQWQIQCNAISVADILRKMEKRESVGEQGMMIPYFKSSVQLEGKTGTSLQDMSNQACPHIFFSFVMFELPQPLEKDSRVISYCLLYSEFNFP